MYQSWEIYLYFIAPIFIENQHSSFAIIRNVLRDYDCIIWMYFFVSYKRFQERFDIFQF